MIKDATVIRQRGVSLDGEHHSNGAVLRLPANQFDDLEGVGIVREATDTEVNGEGVKRATHRSARKPRVANVEPASTDEPPLAVV